MKHNANTPENFWSLVDKRGEDDCWLWRGQRSSDGYGKCTYHNKTVRAHRKAYELAYGDIPAREDEWHGTSVVRHTCDTPLCCNPKHLILGSTNDNNQDIKQRGHYRNGSNPPKGEDNHLSKLTAEKVVLLRELHATGQYTQTKLAQLFDIDQTAVSLIIRRKTWKHI